MISKTNYSEICSLVKEERVLKAFQYYEEKYENLLYLKYNDEAVFSFTKNKNGVYEGQAFFIKIENTNKIILALKERLNARFIPYIQNKNRKEIFEKIDNSLVYLKMHSYSLSKKLDTELSEYKIINAKAEDDLESFYIDCFKDEFDENALIWLRDFVAMAPHLKKGSKLIKIENEIASSIMYWINDDSIFIFLLASNPKFRRRKLAYLLIQEVQNLFPNKDLRLTTWAGGSTEKFYLSIGFQKLAMAYFCI